MEPQPGIFALGNPEHCFVELDLVEGASFPDLVAALTTLSGPETTISGVNFVIGFRPESWGADGVSSFDAIAGHEIVMPADSHVSRGVVEEDCGELKIYRRNFAYGGPTDHGTVFVGFCASQHPLDIMLRRMAGAVDDGVRDALTRYTTPLTGAYYFVPSVDALRSYVS